MSRSRIPRWTPPLGQAMRIAKRSAVAFTLFSLFGFLALLGTECVYERESDPLLFVACGVGLVGALVGQFVGILRVRALPVFVLGGVVVSIVAAVGLSMTGPAPERLAICSVFFGFGFGCGLLALQHRNELLASFWPSVGWIGSVFVILNKENRVRDWENDKITAWLPVPLFFLFCFLVSWLLYLAAKQAMRVELWQSLSGAAGRRISKKADVTAVPRKNVATIVVLAGLLFLVTAILAPYLWRTGKGDRSSSNETTQVEPEPTRPRLDGASIVEQLEKLAEAAKDMALHLWPLLFLLVLYRPVKRALLGTHLLTPIIPTPPTERIDNGWEYVRIAAEDAGVIPLPSDSVEQLLARIREKNLESDAVLRAAEVYKRTRYGFTVQPGDALAMRMHAVEAARGLRANLTIWRQVLNWWRPLS